MVLQCPLDTPRVSDCRADLAVLGRSTTRMFLPHVELNPTFFHLLPLILVPSLELYRVSSIHPLGYFLNYLKADAHSLLSLLMLDSFRPLASCSPRPGVNQVISLCCVHPGCTGENSSLPCKRLLDLVMHKARALRGTCQLSSICLGIYIPALPAFHEEEAEPLRVDPQKVAHEDQTGDWKPGHSSPAQGPCAHGPTSVQGSGRT